MAARFGAQHTEELVEPKVAELLPAIVQSLGEPFGDSSAIPTYLVAELARRSVTVALSGIGGDELFGGYPRYLGIELAGRFGMSPAWVRRTLRSLAPLLPERGGHRDHLSRLKRFVKTSLDPLDLQYARWVTFLPTEWEGRAFAADVAEIVDESSVTARWRDAFDAWPRQSPADRAMGLDLRTYLPDDLLKMGDRMSMAHSLELRVPFCDHELLELALAIPVAERLRAARLKSFMRRSLEPILPDRITRQPKRGFMIPLARWLREDLREMVGDLLSPDVIRRRGFLQPEFVTWLVEEHTAGRRNFADQIYALLSLELWWRGIEEQGGGR
jgi:asparagine synthase (glutamine-hydrolysing)